MWLGGLSTDNDNDAGRHTTENLWLQRLIGINAKWANNLTPQFLGCPTLVCTLRIGTHSPIWASNCKINLPGSNSSCPDCVHILKLILCSNASIFFIFYSHWFGNGKKDANHWRKTSRKVRLLFSWISSRQSGRVDLKSTSPPVR